MHRLSHHVPQQHPVTKLDPRVKLISALALLVMVLSSTGFAFPLLTAALGLALCLWLGVSARVILLRFAEPLFIALVVLLIKTFFSGTEPLFSINIPGFEIVAHRDGLVAGGAIAARIAGAVAVVAAVGFATPFTGLMAALAWLRVPQGFIDVALFAWRYLFVLFDDAQVVYGAQRNRLGYAGFRRGLRSFGMLAGALVIKAFDTSQTITTAMVQRGYDGNLPLLKHRPFRAGEVAASVLFVAAMGVIRWL